MRATPIQLACYTHAAPVQLACSNRAGCLPHAARPRATPVRRACCPAAACVLLPCGGRAGGVLPAFWVRAPPLQAACSGFRVVVRSLAKAREISSPAPGPAMGMLDHPGVFSQGTGAGKLSRPQSEGQGCAGQGQPRFVVRALTGVLSDRAAGPRRRGGDGAECGVVPEMNRDSPPIPMRSTFRHRFGIRPGERPCTVPGGRAPADGSWCMGAAAGPGTDGGRGVACAGRAARRASFRKQGSRPPGGSGSLPGAVIFGSRQRALAPPGC
jgi:hypothetical protein